jgi:hypothetical protein
MRHDLDADYDELLNVAGRNPAKLSELKKRMKVASEALVRPFAEFRSDRGETVNEEYGK